MVLIVTVQSEIISAIYAAAKFVNNIPITSWYISTYVQSMAAIIGLFGAFLAGYFLQRMDEYKRLELKLEDMQRLSKKYIHEQERYDIRIASYRYNELNKKLRNLMKDVIDNKVKNFDAYEYYRKVGFTEFVDKKSAIDKINQIIIQYRKRDVLPELICSTDAHEKEFKEWTELKARYLLIRYHIDGVADILNRLNAIISVRIESISKPVTAIFLAVICLPLLFMPQVSEMPLDDILYLLIKCVFIVSAILVLKTVLGKLNEWISNFFAFDTKKVQKYAEFNTYSEYLESVDKKSEGINE